MGGLAHPTEGLEGAAGCEQHPGEDSLIEMECPVNIGRRFNDIGTLDRHIRLRHREENKQLKCPKDNCNYEFTRTAQLWGHFRAKHGHAKLKCLENNCIKEYSHMCALFRHIKTEHREDNFKKKKLVRHNRSKHEHAKRKEVVIKVVNGQVVFQSGDHDITRKTRVQLHCMEQSCDAKFDRMEDLRAHHMVWHRSQHS